METETLLANISRSTDLELAVLLSLVAQRHCIISTDEESIDDLATELSLIVSETFDLSYAVVDIEQQQSIEDYGAVILNENPNAGLLGVGSTTGTGSDGPNSIGHSRLASVSVRAGSTYTEAPDLDRRMVVNVIIAKNFNFAHRDVQIATLELIQKRRIFSRTTVHPVPKDFLFLPLVSTASRNVRLNYHLNDRIAISHHHAAQDGFTNLEELERRSLSDQQSTSSRDRSSQIKEISPQYHITLTMIEQLRSISQKVSMTPEIRRYIQDIVVFLRMARGVDGGISPFATTLCVELAKCLAALHGVKYVTPSLVALAVRKIYVHRIVLSTPERDRSMQWGSKLEAVKEVLDGLTAEKIIDNVLAEVPCPK